MGDMPVVNGWVATGLGGAADLGGDFDGIVVGWGIGLDPSDFWAVEVTFCYDVPVTFGETDGAPFSAYLVAGGGVDVACFGSTLAANYVSVVLLISGYFY